MKYIENLIHYIDDNIHEIEMPEHNLHEYCCVSRSKLEKDFKTHFGFTLRSYLIRRKMDLIDELLQKNEHMDTMDLMIRAKYNYSDRTLRNHKHNRSIPNFPFSLPFILNIPNRQVFAEVFIRLILLLKEARPEFGISDCNIIHEIKNKNFQFNSYSIDEAFHHYSIEYSLYNHLLWFNHVGIQLPGEEENFYLPETMEHYFSYLFTLHDNLHKQIGFSLKDAIKDWHTYSVDTEQYTNIQKVKKWEIDRESTFILQTNDLIENIRTTFFENCRKEIRQLYGISYETVKHYMQAMEENDQQEMRKILNTIDLLNRKKTLDLFFNITKVPEIDSFIVTEPEVLEKIDLVTEHFTKEKIIDIILDLHETLVSLEKEERFDFNISEWLNEKLQY